MAYDQVSHYGLLYMLIERGLPMTVVKLIKTWYMEQAVRVRWAGQLSVPFRVTSGISSHE